KAPCHNGSCRTNTIVCCGVHCRKIGASGQRVRSCRWPPDSDTNVALGGWPSVAGPDTRRPSDSGLHCGVLVQLEPMEPRLLVCVGSDTFVACASTTRSTPSPCKCTNAR